MKTLFRFVALIALIFQAHASTELRFVRFEPATNTITLTLIEDGFSRSQNVALTSLSPSEQAGVTAALGWLSAQLPGGFQALSQVILEPGPTLVTEWTEIEEGAETWREATAWRRTLNAAVTGSGPAGERTIVVTGGTAPIEISEGILALWDALEAGQ